MPGQEAFTPDCDGDYTRPADTGT